MSQSDKTRQKLVDSMRKTKSGTTGKNESAADEQQSKAESQTQKTEKPATAKPTAKRSEKKTVVGNEADSYQSIRRRVWPD